jgi:hypothetical protein
MKISTNIDKQRIPSCNITIAMAALVSLMANSVTKKSNMSFYDVCSFSNVQSLSTAILRDVRSLSNISRYSKMAY